MDYLLPILKTARSPIHGSGLFALKPIYKGEILFKGIDLNANPFIQSPANKINHSKNPNVIMYPDKKGTTISGYFVVALRHIKKNEEITLNYNNVPTFALSQQDRVAAKIKPA